MNTDTIKLYWKMYKPEIKTGLGLAMSVCGLVDACIATVKAERVITDTREAIADISDKREKYSEQAYSNKEFKKDSFKVLSASAVSLCKIYAFSGTEYIIGNGLMLNAGSDYRSTIGELTTSCAALSEGFRRYRDRVADKYGVEADRDIYYDVKHKKVSEEYLDENGKTKKRKKDVAYSENPFTLHPYTYIWDDGSSVEFSNDRFWNKNFHITNQEYFNNLIRARVDHKTGRPGYVYLHEILTAEGMDASVCDQDAGCLYFPNGDNPYGTNGVDLGLLEMYRDTDGNLCFINEDAINGYEGVWLLDINAIPNITTVLRQY